MTMIQLDRDPLRATVERLVSVHLGRPLAVRAFRDLSDRACHPAALLSDGAYEVFAKFSDAADGERQFAVELAGLELLRHRAGVLIPAPIAVAPAGGGTLLALEAVREVERTPERWREIGRALARIHQVPGDRFGLETHGYFGPLPQDNTPADDWPTFYAERRLGPCMRLAIDSGHLPDALVRQVDTLIRRLPTLAGPPVTPVLLHGDAQQNNWISTEGGPVVIDPAVYYGHAEMDLAALGIFQAVPDAVYEGYQEERAIDPGFWERRDLWRVAGYLASVAVEGAYWLPPLLGALRRYV